jgi:hypothetical protein
VNKGRYKTALLAATSVALFAAYVAAFWALRAAGVHWHDINTPPVRPEPIKVLLAVFFVVTALAALFFLVNRRTIVAGGRRVWLIVAALALSLIIFSAAIPPAGSRDNYWNTLISRAWIIYGRDPYTVVPDDLSGDALYSLTCVTWRAVPMIYGPLWLIFSAIPVLATKDPAASVVLMRLLVSAAYAAAGCLMFRSARRRHPAAAAISAAVWLLNPIAVFEIYNGGHNEGLLVLFLAILAIGLSEKKPEWALPGLTGAVMVKFWPLILLPALLGLRGSAGKWLKGAVWSMILAAGASIVLVRSGGISGMIGNLMTHQQYAAPYRFSPGYHVFWDIFAAVRLSNPQVRTATQAAVWAFFLIFALVVSLSVVRGRLEPLAAARWLTLFFIGVVLNWLQPWYLAAALLFILWPDTDARPFVSVVVASFASALAFSSYAFNWTYSLVLTTAVIGLGAAAWRLLRGRSRSGSPATPGSPGIVRPAPPR